MKGVCVDGSECRGKDCAQWVKVKKPSDPQCRLDAVLIAKLMSCSPDKSVTTRFWIGDNVGSILEDDVEGIVTQICVRPGCVVSYQVAWISAGDRKTAWFEDCELRGVSDMPETIGFVGKKKGKVE